VRYPSPDHNRATPNPIPLKNASVGEVFPMTSVYTTSTVRTKKSEPVIHLWKRPVSIASLEIVWDHVPPSKPYDARDVHEWEENQCKVDELADQIRAISFSVFGWMWRLWLPTVVKAVSVAVTWRLRRWARRIALTWRHYARTVGNPSSIS
jgi:hypothetical protein